MRYIVGALLFTALIGAVFFFSQTSSTSLRTKVRSLKEFELFNDWMITHEKSYESEEELMMRFGIWYNAHHEIENHNAQEQNWTKGHNQFSDLTYEEFSRTYLCPQMADMIPPEYEQDVPVDEDTGVNNPANFNWITKGAVNPITNQKSCGSCWAFAAVATMETAYHKRSGKLVKMSEQQQIDCTKYECQGGWYWESFNFWKTTPSRALSCYPYYARRYGCRTDCPAVSRSTGNIPVGKSDQALENAVLEGTLSVALDASRDFQYYRGGTFTGSCSTRVTHAVNIVGYWNGNGKKWWHIRNSWATSWGEKGYMWMLRDGSSSGKCGINMYVSYTNAA